ncbi:hypothetical protein BDN72DRAFT_445727 [Pluteus cervinus]|uniref:Uncharacterized protein n=1 Tax=Pluteus cervinus TaxID=181527 RepID=A0ACD3BC26_9AGAR|nr:hypothetical protein BDN72DRAFT_445727 [Pluteus cervinus]
MPRVKTFEFLLEKCEYAELISLDEYWTQPSPHMTELSLHNFDISDDFFPSMAPTLRCLELETCAFDVTGLRGFNLVKLCLRNLEAAFTTEDIIAELQNFPELEELRLSGMAEDDDDDPRSESVSLSRLQSLDIECNYDTLLYFLDSISFPKDINLSVRAESTTDMSLVVATLRDCHGGNQWKLDRAYIHCEEDELALETALHMSRILPGGESKDTTLFFVWDEDEDRPEAHEIDRVLVSFDLSALHTLELSSYLEDLPSESSEIWTGLFNSAVALQELKIYGGYSNHFINAFVSFPGSDTRHDIPRKPMSAAVKSKLETRLRQSGITRFSQLFKLPLLKTLELWRFSISESEIETEMDEWPDDVDEVTFANFMLLRQGFGLKLSKMVISGYEVQDEVLQNLAKSADHFEYCVDREWRMGVEVED